MTNRTRQIKCGAYLIKNPLATATEVAKATGVSYGYAHKLKSKVGTPKEVFEREAFENEVMRTDDYDPVGLRLQEWRDMLEREDEDVEEFDLADMLLEKELPLRAQLLREAEDITCGDRHMDYGDPVENHRNIAKIASIATGHNLTAHDVVMVLLAAKMARARISPAKKDHYIDMMAYAGIAYECITDGSGGVRGMKVRAVILIDMELPVANIEATRRKLTAYTRGFEFDGHVTDRTCSILDEIPRYSCGKTRHCVPRKTAYNKTTKNYHLNGGAFR
jgi:hypothetical protein